MDALKSIIQGTLFPLNGRRPDPFAGIVPERVDPRTNAGSRGAQLRAVFTGPSSRARVARTYGPLPAQARGGQPEPACRRANVAGGGGHGGGGRKERAPPRHDLGGWW